VQDVNELRARHGTVERASIPEPTINEWRVAAGLSPLAYGLGSLPRSILGPEVTP
jgi:hypothetical protein